MADDGWSVQEDGKPGDGKPLKFPGRTETMWRIKSDWPLPGTTARVTIREYQNPWIGHDGEVHVDAITIERGRVWRVMPPENGDDGA
jgi:hypothetical protein